MNTKQLRQKILDLAIKGKLVPQDPNDEPASKLLERIRKEKEQLIKEGKLKQDKNESYIFVGDDKLHYEKFSDGSVVCIEDEIPFEIPESWAWCRLKDIGIAKIGLTYKPTDIDSSGIAVLRSNNIKDDKLNLNELIYVNCTVNDNLLVMDNDILICARNGSKHLVGKSALIKKVENKMTFGAFMSIFRSDCNNYIFRFLNSNYFRTTMADANSTQINQLTQDMLKETLCPLPPQFEQKRISETVETLLELVDSIESDKIDLSDLIKQTKAKVLDLAIKGKLVPQYPNDEPADKLLEKIREEKEKLIKEGKLKRDKNETYIFKNSDDNSYYEQIDGETVCIDDDLPFEIPESWRWCRLRETYNICSSKRVLQSEWKTEGVPFYRAREIVKLSQHGFVENELFITNEHYEKLKANYGIPTEGDIMVSGVGTIGKAYVVKSSDKFYYKDASVLCFKRYSKFINSDLFKYLIESYFMQKQLNANSNGTTVDTITISSAGDYLYPLAPYKEQDRILLKIENIFRYLDNLETIIKGS